MGIKNDKDWMTYALQLALTAKKQGEVPVGAVVVIDNQLMGEGYNQVITRNDPSAHAELLAIRQASDAIANYRLKKSTLYVTLEPCCMCAGALVHARVERVVFACRDVKAGACGSVYNLLRGYPLNHQVWIDEGILQRECAAVLTEFFKHRR